jgi:hypothetical protein
MKNKRVVKTLFILCFFIISCVNNKNTLSYNLYTSRNNINVNYSIETSMFIDNDFESSSLTSEQQVNLINFLKKFESNTINIENIIQKDVFKYDIKNINVFPNNNYWFAIVFYSKNKLVDYSKYDENEMCWKTGNYAIFKIEGDKIIFLGWYT